MKERIIIQDDKKQMESAKKMAKMFDELEGVEDQQERIKIVKKYLPDYDFVLYDSEIINGLKKLHDDEK